MKGAIIESEDVMFLNYHSDSPSIDETDGGNSSGGVVLKKGPWTSAEDSLLVEYVKKHGEGNWNSVQKHSGLSRCGKSCRLRWANHLRPNLKKGAFTMEEERLIIELHAKMGNKWARMAAHLPGRTDNEIKNYWNTRTKRRQRAGLPLYPPDLCLQEFQENQHGQNSFGARGHHDPLQHNSCEIPEIIPYVSALSDISAGGTLMKGLGSSEYYSFMPPTIHQHKRRRESTGLFPNSYGTVQNSFLLFDPFQDDSSDKVSWSFGLSFPNDLDHSKSLSSFGVTQGDHSLSNGNYSTSKPVSEAVKLELPSLQYPETDLASWGTSSPPPLHELVDAFVRSPPPLGIFESDCPSPHNSGLLDDLINEAKNLSSAKNPSSEKSSNSSSATPGDVANNCTSNVCEAELEDYIEPISPLGHSENSLFNECISASGSSLDEPPPESILNLERGGANMSPDQEKGPTKELDFTCPDDLLALDWYEQSSGCVKDQGAKTDPIATLLGEDLGTDYKQMASGSSSSTQGWGFSSCLWNNMPAVCQMSDLP